MSRRRSRGLPIGQDGDSLDPVDWDGLKSTFHDAVDQAIDHLRDIRQQPVWRATPDEVKQRLASAVPRKPEALDELLAVFARDILPFGTGNIHPRFFGWVHGSGNLAGTLGEMLAAFMNCNVGGRDHVAVYVERQVIQWCKEIFAFPPESSGILTSGTSMGTVIALAAARDARAGVDVRQYGTAAATRLVGYVSSQAHSSIAKAFELLGLGSDALRLVPADADFRLPPVRLGEMIAADRARGVRPAIVVASAGTVNTGAIDDLDAIASICREQGLWLHVDAAFGGLAVLTRDFRPQVAPIARADSIAFDFHKWLQVPYDAGCVLVKDAAAHRAAFAAQPDYLAATERGLAGGAPWFSDFGPELSRGFRALKIWFTIKAYGIERLAEVIARNCRQAALLGRAIQSSRDLELLAPVSLNIVCFRYVGADLPEAELDRLNGDIVAELQLQGIAAPSTTKIGGKTAIRVALTNHRTTTEDIAILASAVRRLGQEKTRATRSASGPRILEPERR
jgi:aromatic-L-amino-acid/L-tryptophan decarboxylase